MGDGYIREAGELLLTAEAPIWTPDGIRVGLFAVHTATLKHLYAAGMSVSIAQLYGLVVPGLMRTRHIFQGLRRPLYCDGSMSGDAEKLVYTRRPAVDWITAPDKDGLPTAIRCPRPEGKAYCVIISPNDRHKDKFPSVDGWLDHWNWAEEDTVLAEAPIGWVDRYDKRLHTFDH